MTKNKSKKRQSRTKHASSSVALSSGATQKGMQPTTTKNQAGRPEGDASKKTAKNTHTQERGGKSRMQKSTKMYKWRNTAVYVSEYLYVCACACACVCECMCMREYGYVAPCSPATIYVSSHSYDEDRARLLKPHTTIYYYICVLILLVTGIQSVMTAAATYVS
jgi:hypothetical protein